MRALHIFLITLCIPLLLGCNNPAKRYLIGVSQCSNDSWRAKLNEELKTAEYVNDSLRVRILSAGDDSRRQVAQIDSLIGMGADLLIVSPNQLEPLAPAIERAYAKGIPVILYDRKTASEKYTAYIGCDNRQIGRQMGDYIAQRLQGHGRIVEIQGLQGSSAAVERHEGFMEALKDYPDIRLVASEHADWKEDGGRKAMSRLLEKDTAIDYVFAHNDRMAWGAYQVARAHGREKSIHFAGIDAQAADYGGLELVRDGILEASYLYPTKGHQVIDLAVKILGHKPFQRANILEASIVTRDNAEQMLMEAKDGEQQRKNLSFLHSQVDEYVAQYQSQKVILWGLFVFLVFAIGATAMLLRGFWTKKLLNEQLAQNNEDLQRLNREVIDLTQSRLNFFTNISHELRTPLTLIADPVDLLLEDRQIKGRSRDLLKLVKRNARSLQQLVTALLDFRKVQLGHMGLNLTEENLVDLFSRWTDDFRPTAERKHIALNFNTTGLTDTQVITDREKLARIIYNLLSNAIKYTPDGGHITVSLTDSKESADCYTLSVIDTGSGIAAAEIGRVFERFYQAEGAASGTGIGLALVKSFAEMLHGAVCVESKEGEGTTMYVTMPKRIEGEIEQSAVLPTLQLPEEEDFDTPSNTNPALARVVDDKAARTATILIVDDNSDIRQYERTLLGDRYYILEAADGKEALEVATKEIPDLIICDIMMPVMDGLQFCQQLKGNTATSHIPLIMLTAKNLEENQAEGYEYGADSYITKPFNNKVLLSRVDNLLCQRATLRDKFSRPGSQQMADDATERYETLIGEEREGSRDQTFLTQLRTILREHLADSDLSVETIASEIGLSRVQLYRKAKAMTGSSVVDLIRKARLMRAKHLILTTDKNISEIAYEVGFTSPSYFTKCFKDEFGMTPGEMAEAGK